LDATRSKILDALARRESKSFVKRSRALYWDTSHACRAVCTVSKRYTKKGATPYWYAYHPSWDAFLGEGQNGWFVLGCLELDRAFAIPLSVIRAALAKMNTTEKPDGGLYWHVKLLEPRPNQYALQLPKISGQLALEEYALGIL